MFIKTSISNATASKRAAANRRRAGRSDVSGESQRARCSRSASPAAVAELGRSVHHSTIATYWGKHIAVIAVAALLTSGCSAARPLHRSQAAIRASLLRNTPPGTPKKEVIVKIGWHVDQKSGPFAAQAQESDAWNTLRLASEQTGNPHVSKEVKSV